MHARSKSGTRVASGPARKRRRLGKSLSRSSRGTEETSTGGAGCLGLHAVARDRCRAPLPRGALTALPCRSVAWAPDGLLLASGADDCCIYIWDGALFEDAEDAQTEEGAGGGHEEVGGAGVMAAGLAASGVAGVEGASQDIWDDGTESRGSGSESQALPFGAVAKLAAHTAPVLATKFTYSVGRLTGRNVYSICSIAAAALASPCPNSSMTGAQASQVPLQASGPRLLACAGGHP